MWLSNNGIIKNLCKGWSQKAGRSRGVISVRHRGGADLKKYKFVDFLRSLWHTEAIVLRLEKSNFHSSYIALISYPFGVLQYIIAPVGLKPGAIIYNGLNVFTLGSCLFLKDIPFNIKIHNIESYPNSGAIFIRSAGTWAKILEKTEKYVLILFKNGTKKKINPNCTACIGQVSNIMHKSKSKLRNAGHSRRLGIRPSVRGVAMNPVDHPHGGGRGKNSPKNPNYNFVRKLPKGRRTARIN